MINPLKRYQKGLSMHHLYPKRDDGYCACGCNKKLEGRRRRWYNDLCQSEALMNFYVIKGDQAYIRHYLYQIDQGACRFCGDITSNWEADHIIPVFLGGGGKGLDNFQTLCKSCHLEKTVYNLSQRDSISSQALVIYPNRLLKAPGHVEYS